MKRLEDQGPNLSCKNTANQYMLNVFLLITKRADFMMRQSSFGKAVHSPRSIVDG